MYNESAIAFLSLFGARQIKFTRSTPDHLFGLATWPQDSSETQEFAIDTHQPALTRDALTLAQFLRERGLIDVDRLRLSGHALRDAFLGTADTSWTAGRFDTAYGELLRFRIAMVDDGEFTDSFFIHE